VQAPDFRLHAAVRADSAPIRRLIRAARINPTGLDWRRFTVAVEGTRRLIGCGQIKPHPDGSRELASLAVEETWRGQGVASALIKHLQEIFGPPLWLTCRPDRVGPTGSMDFAKSD
jgi:N-acetylglutamate synthase-like GNAT family acetyltransferase